LIPFLLQQLILYLSPQYPRNLLWIDSGIGLAISLFTCQLLSTIFGNAFQLLGAEIQCKVQILLVGMLYRKALDARYPKSNEGKIINTITEDVNHFTKLVKVPAAILVAPIQVAVTTFLIYRTIGVGVAGGGCALLLILLFQAIAFRLFPTYFKKYLSLADDRIKLLREMLYGIRILKLRGWENLFLQRMDKVRSRQFHYLGKLTVVRTCIASMILMAPTILPIVGFIVFAFSSNVMRPSIIFPTLTLWNSLIGPIIELPESLTIMIIARASYRRFVEFVLLPEDERVDPKPNSPGTNAITIKDATFRWEESGQFELKIPNLIIEKGQKVAIVGGVGSGKSSLLSCLIDEMTKCSGDIQKSGTVSYCAQQPWILTHTIQENILFGSELDGPKLDRVIKECGLDTDLMTFPAGLLTGIGEKGVNLSGGQKARVSLARALYKEAEILIMDDVLSALDAKVGRYVFDHAIRNRTGTVIFVTHQLQYLSQMDLILVMENGSIIESGAYNTLISDSGSRLALMLKDSEQLKSPIGLKPELEVEEQEEKTADLIVPEDREEGHVSGHVYLDYIKKCGGWWFLIPLVFLFLLYSGLDLAANLWLSHWSITSSPNVRDYSLVYGLIGGGQLLVNVILVSIYFLGILRSAKLFTMKPFEICFLPRFHSLKRSQWEEF
jgi:ABC-type bacteriocin/lantibiotic exporter with double-glycine peptidase domain